MIEVQNVSKKYGETNAVNQLSFSVPRGEILGFLGPNGAGKTTTMRIITGFIPPTSGSVRVDGLDVLEDPLETKSRIGYLPENSPLYPEMTVAHFLSFMAEMKDLNPKTISREIDRVVEQLELGPVYNRLTGNCSLGYRHRIGLAQALLGDPPVLILDEPTSGLDPRQRIEIRDLIRSLAGERTVILSSHVLPEVQQTCERVVIINKGELVAEDTPSGLASRMQGHTGLRLEARGSSDVISGLLAEIPGIDSVTLDSEKQSSAVFSLEVSPDRDVREDIFNAMAAASCPILEFTSEGVSLEDVFLQLTTEDPAKVPEREEEDADE
ncbi:MAG: ABC transporter ATP-binding protein [Bacillota bacterium]